jgi:hypothetical protein
MVIREKFPESRNRLIGRVALVIGGGSIASAASWRVSTSRHHHRHDPVDGGLTATCGF